MSDGNDNLFSRWSRRKQAVREAGERPSEATGQAPGTAAEVGAGPQEESSAPNEPGGAAEDADAHEPLPRIEDLTADSDLTAFLRDGVPKALRSAAMRRMWSLDPGIRDHVGPAEYAWDFNQPGSMGGFGPLDAKETVVGFLSKTARAIDSDAEEASAPDVSSPQPTADAPSDPEAGTSPDGEVPTDQAELSPAVEPAATPSPVEEADGEAAAEKNRAAPEARPRPRHGGAMPS